MNDDLKILRNNFSRIDKIGLWITLGLCICFSLLAGYGGWQLVTREARLDFKEHQRARIASLETKVMFLENNDWAHAIQQLSPGIQGELALGNEMIKQWKVEVFKESLQ